MRKSDGTDLECLLAVQREMLAESKRMRLLTVWLTLLTAAATAISMIAIVSRL
jgi:hypothetical protein